jgi:excisionase family DNA binding protein
MPTKTVDRDPIVAAPDEIEGLAVLNRLVQQAQPCEVKLVGQGGEVATISLPVLRLLRQAVDALAQDQVVVVNRMTKDLTIDQAAEILNVGTDYLVGLVETGTIPSRRRNGRVRIRFADVMAYKAARDADRRHGLDEMTRLSQEWGLYDRE